MNRHTYVYAKFWTHRFSLLYTLAGCENDSSPYGPDLSVVDGICYILDSTNEYGSIPDYAEWYYGSSIMHKSGRYIYGDGKYSKREGEDAEYGLLVFHVSCHRVIHRPLPAKVAENVALKFPCTLYHTCLFYTYVLSGLRIFCLLFNFSLLAICEPHVSSSPFVCTLYQHSIEYDGPSATFRRTKHVLLRWDFLRPFPQVWLRLLQVWSLTGKAWRLKRLLHGMEEDIWKTFWHWLKGHQGRKGYRYFISALLHYNLFRHTLCVVCVALTSRLCVCSDIHCVTCPLCCAS